MKPIVLTARPSYWLSCNVRHSTPSSRVVQDSVNAAQSLGSSGMNSVLRNSSWPLVFCGSA